MKKYLIYIMFLFVVAFPSCDMKEEYEQINSGVMKASGEWWIKFSKTDYETGYLKVITLNTAADDGKEIWISDQGNWKDIKFKCPVDIVSLTFAGTNLTNTSSTNKIVVKNGKIVEGGGQSTSGVVTDSITFEIEFSDEPGVVYKAVGTRKTGFLEDEH